MQYERQMSLPEEMGNIVVFKNFSNFSEYLNQKNFILLDGATGTLIQKSGVKYDHVPEVLNITHPELIESFHRRYIDAGSDIVYANTFGANAYKLQDSGYSVEEIIGAGVKIARKAVEGTDALVALDIGPIGQLLEPAGSMKFDEAYEYYKQQILAGKDADVIVFETMTDLYELKAAVLAAKENCDKPILTTMTFERNGRTFTGVSLPVRLSLLRDSVLTLSVSTVHSVRMSLNPLFPRCRNTQIFPL